jgi:hypothetical protein
VFFAIIFGIVEFGIGVFQYTVIGNLAKEGARWAAVRGSTCSSPCTQATNANVQTYVQGRSLGLNPSVTTTWPDGGTPSNQPGKRVQVVVQKSFTPLTTLIPNATLTISSTAQLVISR